METDLKIHITDHILEPTRLDLDAQYDNVDIRTRCILNKSTSNQHLLDFEYFSRTDCIYMSWII